MEIHSLNSKTPSATDVLALDTGSDTYKATGTAVVENAAPTYTSGDAASPTSWTDVTVLSSGLSVKTLLNRISTMIKNVRWLYSKLGTTELGTTATTITGAIAEHEADISGLNSNIEETNNNYPNTAKIVTLLIESATSGIRITALSGASYTALIWTTNGNVVFTNRQGGAIRPVITELSGSLAAKSADQDDNNKANVFLRPGVQSRAIIILTSNDMSKVTISTY